MAGYGATPGFSHPMATGDPRARGAPVGFVAPGPGRRALQPTTGLLADKSPSGSRGAFGSVFSSNFNRQLGAENSRMNATGPPSRSQTAWAGDSSHTRKMGQSGEVMEMGGHHLAPAMRGSGGAAPTIDRHAIVMPGPPPFKKQKVLGNAHVVHNRGKTEGFPANYMITVAANQRAIGGDYSLTKRAIAVHQPVMIRRQPAATVARPIHPDRMNDVEQIAIPVLNAILEGCAAPDSKQPFRDRIQREYVKQEEKGISIEHIVESFQAWGIVHSVYFHGEGEARLRNMPVVTTVVEGFIASVPAFWAGCAVPLRNGVSLWWVLVRRPKDPEARARQRDITNELQKIPEGEISPDAAKYEKELLDELDEYHRRCGDDHSKYVLQLEPQVTIGKIPPLYTYVVNGRAGHPYRFGKVHNKADGLSDSANWRYLTAQACYPVPGCEQDHERAILALPTIEVTFNPGL